ncbi:MAG: hypothetical protein ACI9JN_000776 [Bacteroidia bacterium]|jgi:hypothetical protein
MNRLTFVLLGLVIISSSACKSKTDALTEASINFRRTACFGTCPIYDMTIAGSGLVTFKGERFTPKIGNFTKQLTGDETKALFDQLYGFDWTSFDDHYPTQVTDLPRTIVELNYKDIRKKVIVIGEHPAELDVVHNILSKLAESDGWTDMNTQ